MRLALLLYGSVVHTPTFGPDFDVLPNACIGVDHEGVIRTFIPDTTVDTPDVIPPADRIVRLSPQSVLCPGLIDLHCHAPQYSYAGTATDTPLMKWLEQYAFPAEASASSPKHARMVYRAIVSRLLSLGTTTAVYFGTTDVTGCKILADMSLRYGQRAYIGKVCMDNGPGLEDTTASLRGTKEFLEYVDALPSRGLVTPVVTPRFVPTSTLELLRGLGDLVTRGGSSPRRVVQSHISESLDAVAATEAAHGEGVRDITLFRDAGLLGSPSLFAHGVHLREDEVHALSNVGSTVIHCPLSHAFFAHGVPDVAKWLRHGYKVGLGTDVAGGYSPSMLHCIRTSVALSCLLTRVDASGDGTRELGLARAFWMATQGGAEALGIGDRVGSFCVGKDFDAVLLETPEALNPEDTLIDVDDGGPVVTPNSHITIFPSDTLLDRFTKFLNLGDERDIRAVWVKGRKVVGLDGRLEAAL